MSSFAINKQYVKFCLYGFLRNLRFFDAFFLLFLLEKGLSYTEIGLLYAVREICINVCEIPSGIVADSWGRKTSLVASFIAYIISFMVFYISDDFWLFMAAFVLFGIGDAFRTGTHKGIIMNYLELNAMKDQKINYYGHTRSWSQRGAALSSLIAGLIVFYSGDYRSIFIYSVIPYILNLLLIISYPDELNHPHEHKENRAGIGAALKAFFKNITKPNVIKIVNVSAIHSAYLKAVKDYIQPLMVNVAFLIPIMLDCKTDQKNGIIIGILYFIIYFMTSFASKFAANVAAVNKNSIAYITLFCGLSCGIICGIFYVCEMWIPALIAFVGIYMIENARRPIMTGFIADNVENKVLASVISMESSLKTLMTSGIAVVIGIVADNFGIGTAFIGVTAFLLLLSVALNTYTKK
jgi:MFS family permease